MQENRREAAMTDTQTTSGDDLKQKLSRQLDGARAKLDDLKSDLARMHAEDVETLQRRREELDQHLKQQKDRARQLHSEIDTWRKEKTAHTKEAIASWRERREVEKLQSRAERAENYALDLVTIAALDFEEAEQAVLEAVTARFDAESTESAARS
jgi:hypothetical protein